MPSKTYTCCRCGHKGPQADFMVNRGSVSKSCNTCLDQLFKKGKVMPQSEKLAKKRTAGAGKDLYSRPTARYYGGRHKTSENAGY